ncbi:hypothetical protein Cme02nite_31690 [Catellatospora methionotrophica]|uniref:Uncharacterized protein n=1 Tax=Catellatospora methionotrophica TaxID=121620 RepID=A0A8J3PF39_9ACTN|nr:hypothetical protein Cme02nite_31690 [Catellatospora methionotrophica]
MARVALLPSKVVGWGGGSVAAAPTAAASKKNMGDGSSRPSLRTYRVAASGSLGRRRGSLPSR